MEIRNITGFPTDYLDAYCEAELGHTNWAFVDTEDNSDSISFIDKGTGEEIDVGDNEDVHTCVVFFNLPKEAHGNKKHN